MKVAICTVQAPLIRGGSEALAESLRGRLRADGHQVEIVALPWDGDGTDSILAGIEAARTLDLERLAGFPIDRVIALKFPAYLVRHPRKTVWLIHQHHGAYERWDSPQGLINSPDGRLGRAAVHAADREVFAGGCKVFAISRTVAKRLTRLNRRLVTVLYPPPPQAEEYTSGPDLGYYFFPSRLAPNKRHELVLEALAATRLPHRLILAGAADSAELEADLRARAEALGLGGRVEWRGKVGDAELRALYAHCRAVIFPPLDEDYGYITLEAMLAAKPLITCEDSGGPLEFVNDGVTGRVVPARAEALAEALDQLAAEPALAAAWGEAGRALFATLGIGWPQTLDALLERGR